MVRARPATVAATEGGRIVVRRRAGSDSLREEVAMMRYKHVEPRKRAISARKMIVAMVER